VVGAFACEAWLTRFDSQLGNTKDFKNGICCFYCKRATIKGCVEDKETNNDYNPSWRYNTTAVIKYKAPKNHLYF